MVELASLVTAALANAVPLALAGIGEALLERSGRVNLGVEGLMAIGAAVGVLAGIHLGSPYLALLGSGIAAAMLSLLYVVPVILMGADQIVAGLALFFAGTALADLVGSATGGAPAPPLDGSPRDPIAASTLALAAGAMVLLYRSWLGVEIRAMGESEEYAVARGLRVPLIQGGLAVAAAFLAGVAGAYMALALHNGRWYSGITAGWGWIALGLVILGYWSPAGVLLASLLTGALLASRTLLAAYGVNEALADMAPYLAVLAALLAMSLVAGRRVRPPAMVWRRE
ncbi:MAG: ABC transporter permease [Desulfurococcales archaeon]|nr:ABC transporter permease [Desulfurococcales archaeon]